MFPILGPSLILSIILCVHVVRTQQPMYWLWIILVIPWLGAIIYLIAVVLPGLSGGSTARRVTRAARDTLDPHREYRVAKSACDDIATVHNQMRLAKAAAALGRYEEAESLYRQAAQGVHADDPTLLLGRATALIELGRAAEALSLIGLLGPETAEGHAPAVTLVCGRVFEALGRVDEAAVAYRAAAERLPGLEGLGRYAAFLARHGRADEAREAVADMNRRIAKTNPQFRAEARAWRDLAARALADG